MAGIRALLTGAVVAWAGCATEIDRDRAFTEDWAYERSQDEEAWKPGGEMVLTGKVGKGPRSTLHVDEEGKTALRLGGRSRFSTDVRLDGGNPDVKIKYKIGF